MPYSIVVGYQHFRGTCSFHLLDEMSGDGKGVIDLGMEYKRGWSPVVNRKWGRTAILVVAWW
jgi:hypothetical protein